MTEGISRRFPHAAVVALFVVFGILFLHFFSGRVLSVLFPFFFAWLSARLTLPPARRLAKRTKIPVRVWAVFLTLLLFSLIGFCAFLLIRRLIVECAGMLSDALSDPGLPSRIAGTLEKISSFVSSHIPGEAGNTLFSEEDLAGMVRDAFSSLFSSFSRFVGGILSRVPSFLLSLFVSVIAAVWFAADPDGLARLKGRLLPPAWQAKADRIGRGIGRGARAFFYAYGILFCVTFLILLIGLSVLRVDYALLLSLFIALFDLLPVLGAGGILIPWGIVSVVSGRGAFGACLFSLSLLIFIVRQILTPRLFGRGLGIHPLLAFFAVYAGLRLAGAAGMLAGLFLSVLISRRFPDRRVPDNTE